MMKDAPFRAYCEQRLVAHQLRELVPSEILAEGKIERDGATLINFASNDYLGLSQHPALIARAEESLRRYGTGTTASRLVIGNHPLYEIIESKLARGKGTEAALILASGYQANLTVLAALADSAVIGRPVVILADRLSHNSLLQAGLLASASSDTRIQRYNHNDTNQLESLLEQICKKNAQAMIVTESVFGMDGDCADLGRLSALAERYEALLYVDEAHATGLYGAKGFGFCAGHSGRIDIAMGTFGKALGSFGAYIACSTTIRDYLVQRCGGLIYSTALPPSVLASIDAALDLLPTLDKERAQLTAQASRFRHALLAQGWNCGDSMTHIIPVILGDEQAATTLAQILKRQGILAPAIRPPTVPRGTSRLRFSLSAAHSEQDVEQLIAAMAAQAQHFLLAA